MFGQPWHQTTVRRHACFTPAIVLLAVWSLLLGCPAAARADAETIRLRAAETAGIRRRNDVVSGRVRLPKALPADALAHLRLMRDGEPVRAQLTPVRNAAGLVTAVHINLIDHFAPLEVRHYSLEYGTNVTPPAAPSPGLQVSETPLAIVISNRGRSDWQVPKSLVGLLSYTRGTEGRFVGDGSAGAELTIGGRTQRLSDRRPDKVSITRTGPIAAALRYEYEDRSAGVSNTLELEFVRTKSWVRVRWTVDDPQQTVSALACGLNLKLDDSEKLLDFGGGDYVYATLRANQAAELEAWPRDDRASGQSWVVRHGRGDSLEPIVTGTPRHPRVGGWMHVSDATRCTALAVSNFGVGYRDRMSITSDGRLRITRDRFAEPSRRRVLEFGIHFVSVPVQIGARTSPQSMAAPVVLRVADDAE